MKLGRLILALSMAFSVGTFAYAAEEKKADKKAESKFTEGSCCDKAQKAGKECKHPCCVEATGKGEVCTKCNKPKSEKK